MQLLARWLGNPLVFVVMASAVTADVAYWRLATMGHASLLGGESVLTTQAVRAAPRWPCTALVEGRDGGLRLVARGAFSETPTAGLLLDEAELPPGTRIVAHLRCPVVTTSVGLAAPVLETTPYRLVMEPAGPEGLSARHEVAGRYLFARYLREWLEQRGHVRHARVLAPRLARGDGVSYRVRLPGLVHDGVVAACLAAGVASLGMCPWWMARRVRGGPGRRGWCAACGYDLRGLPGGVCPECGNGPGHQHA